MSLDVRLDLLSAYGIPATNGCAYSVSGDESWRPSNVTRKSYNCRRLSRQRETDSQDSYRREAHSHTTDGHLDAIGLSIIGIDYPDAFNAASAVTTVSGTAALLDYARPFAGVGPGVGHTDGGTNPIYYQLGLIDPDRAFAVEFRRAAADDDLYRLDWGSFTGGWRWYLEIRKGQIRIMRLAHQYTAGGITTVINAAVESSLQATIDTAYAADPQDDTTIKQYETYLYASVNSLDPGVGGHGERLDNVPLTFVFIPERRGFLTVQLQNGACAAVENVDITATRVLGDMWKSSALGIYSASGQHVWRFGYPIFATTGTVRVGKINSDGALPFLAMTVNKDDSYPSTGIYLVNDIERAYDPGPPPVAQVNSLDVTLIGDGTYTPFLYSFNAIEPNGERNGGTSVVWSSADHLDTAGNNPTLDMRVTEDNRGRMLRCNVSVRCGVNSQTGDMELGSLPQPRHRFADIYVNGDIFLKGGFVTNVEFTDVSQAAERPGGVATATLTLGFYGTGYTVGDTLRISGGSDTASLIVASVDGLGAIQSVSLGEQGYGYSTGPGQALTGGTGSGATVDILTLTDFSPQAQGLAGGVAPKPYCVMTVTVESPWCLTHEQLLQYDIVLDGLQLSDGLKLLLRDASWLAAEYSGIAGATGRIIPAAAPGEPPACRIPRGTSYGDAILSLMKNYGGDDEIVWDAIGGTWSYLTAKPTAKYKGNWVDTIYQPGDAVQSGGDFYLSTGYHPVGSGAPPGAFWSLLSTVATFSTAKDAAPPYRLEVPVDRQDSDEEFKNVLLIQGALNRLTGIAHTYTIRDMASVTVSSPQQSRYVGRWIPAPVVVDESLREFSDVVFAAKSLASRLFRVNHLMQAQGWFIPNLHSDDFVVVDGQLMQIHRVPEMSTAADHVAIGGVGGKGLWIFRRLD